MQSFVSIYLIHRNESIPKRSKTIDQPATISSQPDNTNDDSIFKLLATEQQKQTNNQNCQENDLSISNPAVLSSPSKRSLRSSFASATAQPPSHSFLHLIAENAVDDEINQAPTAHVPIDWSLKTKLRLLTLRPLSGTGLKTCQEASGITSFVRCINAPSDTAADSHSGLDSSMGARFHQATMYWQHPHLPWLQLFPRNARSNSEFSFGIAERDALAKDWAESARALFQLLRARQCAYFYVCANSYNVLFCAAGIGGRDEVHAFLTPTTRGMRDTLTQEEIEFTLPLKTLPGEKKSNNNRSLDSGVETSAQSTSFSNGSDDTRDDTLKTSGSNVMKSEGGGGSDSDDSDEDQDEWLASLGVEAAEIRKIGVVGARAARTNECVDDFSDHSIALIEGVECQAFFNYLLHSKNTITKTGRLAGVPPTLLAPVAFPGATLRTVQTRATKIRMDGVEYHSLELKGVILPHVLLYLCSLMRESKDTFSATLTGNVGMNSFSKAAQRLMEGEYGGDDTLVFSSICNDTRLKVYTLHLQINRPAIMFLVVKTCPTVAYPLPYWRRCVVVPAMRCAASNACASTKRLAVIRGTSFNFF